MNIKLSQYLTESFWTKQLLKKGSFEWNFNELFFAIGLVPGKDIGQQ